MLSSKQGGIRAAPSADTLCAVAQTNHTRRTESETYDIYLLPPNEDPETCSSWLRMRNRDGRYNLMFEEWVTDGPFIISPRITFEARPGLGAPAKHSTGASGGLGVEIAKQQAAV